MQTAIAFATLWPGIVGFGCDAAIRIPAVGLTASFIFFVSHITPRN
jgi:hypothetical protein